MVIRIQLVLLDLFRIYAPDGSFRELFADSRVDLTHLGPLADFVAFVLERFRGLYRSQSG
jgi:hypothetical protein